MDAATIRAYGIDLILLADSMEKKGGKGIKATEKKEKKHETNIKG